MSKQEEIKYDSSLAAFLVERGFIIEDLIGHGSFGKVYSIDNKSGVKLALKIIDLAEHEKKFHHEFSLPSLSTVAQINHENIIKILFTFQVNSCILVLMELAPNGTVADFLEAHGALCEKKTFQWFGDLAYALEFLHNRLKMIHRDVKLENLLLNTKWNVILTDFDFARICLQTDTNFLCEEKNFRGTKSYRSPELIRREPCDPFLVDVWASGVVLFVMLNNRFPFDDKHTKTMLKEQLDGVPHWETSIKYKTSFECKDLLGKMLNVNVKFRYTISEVIKHLWFKKSKKAFGYNLSYL